MSEENFKNFNSDAVFYRGLHGNVFFQKNCAEKDWTFKINDCLLVYVGHCSVNGWDDKELESFQRLQFFFWIFWVFVFAIEFGIFKKFDGHGIFL